MVFFHPYLALNTKFSSQRPQNTPSFIKIVQELSLGFQNKNPTSSRFNHGFSKQIEDLESLQRRLEEAPIIFAYRGTWGYLKNLMDFKNSCFQIGILKLRI